MSTREPVIISFYAGADYYHEAARKLRSDCDSLGVAHDIVELSVDPSEGWIELCRRKIPFFREMLRKHQRPVLWMDVDCRLLQRPAAPGDDVDLGLFLRGFRYLRDTDPLALSRLWQPSIVLFNDTERTRGFVELMAELEAASTEVATDDYFLQEAWLRYPLQLSLLIFRPDQVCEKLPAPPSALFCFGRSGQVSEHKGRARQHEPQLLAGSRRKAVFMQAGAEAGRTKRLDEALLMLQKAFEIDPGDAALALRIARLLRRMGRMPQALSFLDALVVAESDLPKVFQLDVSMEDGQIDTALQLAHGLIAHGNTRDAAWAQSRLLRIQLEQRATQAGLTPAQRPALWWMENPYPGNFGDILNPYIIEKLSGKPPRFVSKGKGMLAIGSIIKFAIAGTSVWGSGTPRMTDRLNPAADYRAVRGPLTRQLVLESGGTCPEVYGDVAWFLPRLYQPKPVVKRYKLGLIRHYANDDDLSVGEGVKVIPVIRAGYDGIEQFIDELHECECILSTSLHGLIVSHAYGIPARWCEVPDSLVGLPGDGTKFYDYLLSVGMEQEPPLALPCGSVVSTDLTSEAQRLPSRQIDLEALSAAAPFEILYPWRNSS